MSYTKILADKDYGNYLIDKCYQDEPFKFRDNNKSYADLKDLIDPGESLKNISISDLLFLS